MRKALFVLLALLICGPVFAANKVGTFGAPNASGVYPMEVFDDRSVVIATDSGMLMSYESATAGDTLTVNDCNRTFLVSAATTLTYTLPTASTVPGCKITLVATDGGAIKKINVDPASTDKLRGVVNSSAGDTFAIGDAVISPGNTNDTISIISNGVTVWDVIGIRGTWVDNN
jgi:hypothetical protein